VSHITDPGVFIILLDIEGTTTPVDFVYQRLFPYAFRKLPSFLQEHFQEPETRLLIRNLYSQHQTDERHELMPPAWIDGSDLLLQLRSCVAYAQWLMNKNSKYAALKALQGKIWQEGYNSGELQGEVYSDVPQAFERWRRQKREVCIYSSGSILAQQLLFSTAKLGNLTPYITTFFDSNIGTKTEIESYRKIAESLGRIPRDFLFVSDAKEEIEAAYDADMQVILCDRVNNKHLQIPSSNAKKVISSFDEIFPDLLQSNYP
jgi:enolase-phosphatase E1